MIEAPTDLTPELTDYTAEALAELGRIPDTRREKLRELASFVRARRAAGEVAKLTFICTHNSRRSHMSQVWAQTAAHYFRIDGVETYSGGTEATAFNPRAVAALRRAGFVIDEPDGDDNSANPVYAVRFAPETDAMACYSKVYDDEPNPKQGFAAVMTCSSADMACPLVAGATTRIAIPFDDPKEFDGTDLEQAKYDERCRQIAREMFFVFSEVKTS